MKQVKLKLVKSALCALAACACVFSAFAGDTWYLNKSLTTPAGHLNAKNWTSQTTGQPGTDGDALNAEDDYVIARTTKVDAALTFPGASLSIGDVSDPGVFEVTAGLNFTFNRLNLVRGYLNGNHYSTSLVNHHYYGPVCVDTPAGKPFGIYHVSYGNRGVIFDDAFSGPSTAWLYVGARLNVNGTSYSYSTQQNCWVYLKQPTGYYGTIDVFSQVAPSGANVGYGLIVGNGVTTSLPGTVNIHEKATLADRSSSISTVGDITLKRLSFADQTRLSVGYDSSSGKSSTFTVTDSFSVAEGAKVEVYFPSTPASTSAGYYFPVLTVPAASELSLDNFYLTKGGTDQGYGRGSLEITEDEERGTKTLGIRYREWVRQTTASGMNDSDDFETEADFGSAMTNAAKWSDNKVPHAGPIYYSGTDRRLRTPWSEKNADYEFAFPSDTLIVENAFYLCCSSFVCDHFRVTGSGAKYFYLPNGIGGLRTFRGEDFYIGDDVTMTLRIFSNTTLDLRTALKGGGDIVFTGVYWSGNPNGYLRLNGDNSGWTGKFKANMGDTTKAKRTWCIVTVDIDDGCALGGARESFAYDALHLACLSRLNVKGENTVLSDGLNRGIFVDWGAQINVSNTCALVSHWPITLDGTLYKEGAGTLALGGVMKFLDGEGALTDTPPADDANRTVNVEAGVLKPLSAGCVDGAKLVFSAGTELRFDLAAQDADLRAQGLRNVKASAPFAFPAEKIQVGFENVTEETLAAIEASGGLGLVTVSDTAGLAESVLNALSIPRLKTATRRTSVRIADVGNGRRTILLEAEPRVGMGIIIR